MSRKVVAAMPNRFHWLLFCFVASVMSCSVDAHGQLNADSIAKDLRGIPFEVHYRHYQNIFPEKGPTLLRKYKITSVGGRSRLVVESGPSSDDTNPEMRLIETSTYDKENFKKLRDNKQSKRQLGDTGQIDRNRSTLGHFLFSGIGTTMLLDSFQNEEAEVTQATDEDGMIILRIESGSSVRTVHIDPERGNLVTKSELSIRGEVMRYRTVELEKIDGIWIPKEVITYNREGGEVYSRTVVDFFTQNPEISEHTFDLQFPPGTAVTPFIEDVEEFKRHAASMHKLFPDKSLSGFIDSLAEVDTEFTASTSQDRVAIEPPLTEPQPPLAEPLSTPPPGTSNSQVIVGLAVIASVVLLVSLGIRRIQRQ